MEQSLSPREIQARIRTGASVADLVAESGMPAERVDAFAGPVLAEREHMALSAQKATIRRRGEAGSHRRLGDLVANRLRARSIDADDVGWDAWRQSDHKWRVVATLSSEVAAEERRAEFVFDPKGRFSVADNRDARWMIGEEQVGVAPEDENTVDLNDELALVRATQPESHPRDEMPTSGFTHEANEDTSELDSLYDMLSGISEDSVRIYTGILDQADEEPADTPDPEADEVTTAIDPEPESPEEPTQDPLVEDEAGQKPPRKRRRRAKVPSWDEIMFGGPPEP